MPKISVYPDNGVKNSDQYVVANAGVNYKRLGILPHLYKIVPSISGNNLVLALQDLDGNVFSASNPLQTKIGDELAIIESALSTTKAAGTNWNNLGSSALATKEVDLFAYLINETGASAGIKLGWSRIPYGRVVGDFSSTTTNEKYLAGPTNYNATDKVQNIGRFNAILSAGAGYTWSLPATSVIINRPITESRWLDWIPAVAPTAGAITSYTLNFAKYIIGGTRWEAQYGVVITNNGTGSGALTLTVPFTTVDIAWGIGKNITTPVQLVGSVGDANTIIGFNKYDNSYPVATGDTIRAIASGEF